ncbi:Enoyl-CoA hydratase/carnithine racemase [Pseudonocardia thermophila]|uniref:Enoyl-CoA hydratase/carnithine racemase n=1 Tax=Pseudonocardia thermophila TaxID=1848 RepID=A0A1M6VYX0_PSETH|nr:crotonase/enoyl-CoA hydratase family protein [Pseudonocardia thermophila]SHK86691.1 Enoyl-CoA hydratase/carnithine racemase [Pseudonocardia thermophila]
MGDRVLCTVDGGVADVRLNRPAKLNALDSEMFAALAETGEALRAERGLRAVVLSGEGRSFCAGLDTSAFGAMAQGREWRPAGREPADPGAPSRGQRAVLAFRDLPVPVIAAVRGHALGGGLQLALGADIRIAAPGAVFAVLEVRWGLVPDMVGTQLLPRLVGPDVAAELIFTGRRVDAAEAHRIGLVTRIADDPLAAAHELAAEIAARSPDAVRAAKELLAITDYAAGLAAERAAFARLAGSPNQREAAAASLARRAPRFADPEEQP